MATTCADATQWWHQDESQYVTNALDLVMCSGAQTDGVSVYYQDYGYSAANLAIQFRNHDNSFTNCSGVDAEVYDLVYGWYLGGVHYVHIWPAEYTISAWYEGYQGWNIRLIGSVAGYQTGGCPFTGVHLHQSNRTDTGVFEHHSSGLSDPISPTGNVDTNWLHALNQWW